MTIPHQNFPLLQELWEPLNAYNFFSFGEALDKISRNWCIKTYQLCYQQVLLVLVQYFRVVKLSLELSRLTPLLLYDGCLSLDRIVAAQ